MVEKGSDHMKGRSEIYKVAHVYLNKQKRRRDQQHTKREMRVGIGIWEESLMYHVLKVRNEEGKRRRRSKRSKKADERRDKQRSHRHQHAVRTGLKKGKAKENLKYDKAEILREV